MDSIEVEIKEEPVFEEFDADISEDIKEEELDDGETIKIEIFPEPKYEVVEEELVSYDLLSPSIYTIVSDSNDRVSVVPIPQNADDTIKQSKPDHQSGIVKAKSKQSRKKMVQCKACKAKFFSNHTLVLHAKTHRENTLFTCDKCSDVFTSLGLLMEHQKVKKHFKATDTFNEKVRALHKKKYKCKSCGLVFYSEKTFRFHVKIHAGLMKYSCDVCDEMFNTLSDLSFHREKVGHGMKCHDCGTICATVQEMDQHVKMHTKWKFYKCTDCNFSTVVQKHLRQHRTATCPALDKDALAGTVMCASCSTLFENKDIYLRHECPAAEVIKPEDPIIVDGNCLAILQDGSNVEITQIETEDLL